MGRKPYVVISLPFLIIGLALIINGAWRLRLVSASLNWPIVPGMVTTTDLLERSAIDGGTKYTPRISFTYTVDGVSYESNTYTYGKRTLVNEYLARSIVTGYEDNKEIIVHYNPRKPQQSVVRMGDKTGLDILIGTGVVVMGLGLAALAYGQFRRTGL